MRVLLKLGAPLHVDGKRYKDIFDRRSEQDKYIVDEFMQRISEHLTGIYEDDKTGFTPYIVNKNWAMHVIQLYQYKSVGFLIMPISFVFCYLVYHLNSFFLAFVSTTLIIFSFPLSLLITEGIFKATFYGDIQNGLVFMVMGIAADDLFVFIDAWRQSESVDKEIINNR